MSAGSGAPRHLEQSDDDKDRHHHHRPIGDVEKDGAQALEAAAEQILEGLRVRKII